MTGWVRLWHDMPTDPKWRVIAKRSGQRVGDVIAVFNFLMVSASANASERGRTHDFESEDVAAALDLESSDVDAIIKAMTGKVLDTDGRLTGWEKRQPKREDSSADRAAKWRAERKRTQTNASERPEIDTDTEVDRKKEKVTPSPKKGSHFPLDWKPCAKDTQYAASKGLTPVEISRCEEDFRDHSLAVGNRKSTDWSLNWNRWCRKFADERGSRRSAGQTGKPSPGGNGSKPVSMAGILAERRRSAGIPDDIHDRGGLSPDGDGLSGVWINPGEPGHGSPSGPVVHDEADSGSVRGMDSGASRGNGSPW